MTATVVIETQNTAEEIHEAYLDGTKKLGLDFQENVCAEYEHNQIQPSVLKKLRELGWVYHEDPSALTTSTYMNPELYSDIWLFLVRLGSPTLAITIIPQDQVETINIGGYGLFT